MGVSAWRPVSAVPRHSWLGCCGVCLFLRAQPVQYQSCLGFVVRVCWFHFSPSPCQSWLRCWGVFVSVHGPRVLCLSWLGCVEWLCVLGFRSRLCPAIPGWGVGVCAFVCAQCLYITDPGRGMRCDCMYLGWGRLRRAIPGRVAGVCVFVCTLRLYPPILAGVCGACVRVRVLAFNPPILAGVFGCVRFCARCVWVCVFVCAMRPYLLILAEAPGVSACVWISAFTPPILAGMLGSVCFCACSARTTPILACVGDVAVCAWVRVGCAAPFLAGVLGCVCLCLCSACTPESWLGFVVRVSGFVFWLSPRQSWLGCWGVCVCARALLCSVCAGCMGALRLYPASSGWDRHCGCVLGFYACTCTGGQSGALPPCTLHYLSISHSH